jgi:hypothetical protein
MGTAGAAGNRNISMPTGNALATLQAQDLVYASFESRGDIAALVTERGANWPRDPDGAPLYPGSRNSMSDAERTSRMAAGEPYALRLDMAKAVARAGALSWSEAGRRPGRARPGRVAARPDAWGDVILARKESADELSPVGRGRRCAPGRHARRARAGSVLVDQRPPAVAGAAGAAGSGLSASPAWSSIHPAASCRSRRRRPHSAPCGRAAQPPPASGG